MSTTEIGRGRGFQLRILALIKLDTYGWALLADANAFRPEFNLSVTVLIAVTGLLVWGLIQPRILIRPQTWLALVMASGAALFLNLPYSSNLYFLWFYLDLGVLAVLTLEPRDTQESLAAGARRTLSAVFGIAFLQKLTSPDFVSGLYYYQAFSSGIHALNFAHSLELFGLAPNLTETLVAHQETWFRSLEPAASPGTTVDVPLYASPTLSGLARLLTGATLLVELGCAVVFFGSGPCWVRPRQVLLSIFLLGTYALVPLIYSWGLTLAALGAATEGPEARTPYPWLGLWIFAWGIFWAPQIMGSYIELTRSL